MNVTVRATWWSGSKTPPDPDWWAQTDSAGCARLRRIDVGLRKVEFCHNEYEPAIGAVRITRARTDTLRERLVYVGPPFDGRPCEVRFVIEGSPSKKLKGAGKRRLARNR